MSKEEAILRLNSWAADFKEGVLEDAKVHEVLEALSESFSPETLNKMAQRWGLEDGS